MTCILVNELGVGSIMVVSYMDFGDLIESLKHT